MKSKLASLHRERHVHLDEFTFGDLHCLSRYNEDYDACDHERIRLKANAAKLAVEKLHFMHLI